MSKMTASPRPIRVAMACLALTFTGDVLAQTDVFLGCWKTVQVTRAAPGMPGSKETPNCFNLIEDDQIKEGCVASNWRRTTNYRIDGPGVLETTSSFTPKSKGLTEYKLEGDKLTLLFYVNAPTKYVSEIRELKKVILESGQACLPPQLLVSKEEFSRYLMIPQLVAAHTDHTLRPFFAMAFSKEQLGNIPEKAIRPEHARRLLEEFDKVAGDLSAPIRKRLESDPQSLVDAFFDNYRYDSASDRNLAGIEKQQWAKDSARELLEVGKLSAYVAIIGPIFKNALGKASVGPDRIDKNYGIGDTYILDRELLQAGIYELLPEGMLPVSRDSLVVLRKLSRNNAELAKSRRYFPPLELDKALGKAASQILEKDKTELAAVEKTIREKLELLGRRFRYTLDPWEMGNCKFDDLDLRSAAVSDGDWKIAKKANGEPIVQGSLEHMHLSDFFHQGCGPKKDFARMRKTMEDIVAGRPQPGEPVEATNRRKTQLCALARWTRYGIGGERSEERAMDYEKQFRSVIYKVTLNPTESELANLKARYPDGRAASENFLCFRPPQKTLSDRTLVDPRDPWVDLR